MNGMRLNKSDALDYLITLRISSHYLNGVTYASRENSTAIPELIVCYSTNAASAVGGDPSLLEQSQFGSPTRVPNNNKQATLSPTNLATRMPT
mmetsp:Transcript_30590/g.66158  ORF Transcript_30590/g.66158 Transcript_30590/m.66158 type:complete len:93 (+) Transcript_30590:907-1185(+)